MGELTSIGWTQHTWNMGVWGCTEVAGDPACSHCYARDYAKMRGFDVWGDSKPRRFLSEAQWKEPLKWNAKAQANGTRALVFCASMADIFEDREDYVPLRARFYGLMQETPWLTWQLLTKRPLVALKWWRERKMLPNVWMGVTAVTQKWVDERVPILLQIPAPVRFVSCEPLMEQVDLDFEKFDELGGLQWVIAGGESGHKRREMDIEWVRDIAVQCKNASIPCFVKQDSGQYPGRQGRIPDDLWALKGFPA